MTASLQRYREFVDGFVQHSSRNQKAEGLRRRCGLPPRENRALRMAAEEFLSFRLMDWLYRLDGDIWPEEE